MYNAACVFFPNSHVTFVSDNTSRRVGSLLAEAETGYIGYGDGRIEVVLIELIRIYSLVIMYQAACVFQFHTVCKIVFNNTSSLPVP